MIVCHCNVITERAIRETVDDLLSHDIHRVITPGLVYMTMGKRGRCCGCFPNAIAVIRAQVDLRMGRFVETATEDADEAVSEAA